MAPTQKRASIRTRARAATKPAKSTRDAVSHPTSTHIPAATSTAEPDWRANKKDKRAIRHSALMNKVRDAGVKKPTPKRRRPGKKLGVEMGGLGDALPDVNGEEDEWEGLSGEDDETALDGAGVKKAKRIRGRKVPAEGEGRMVMKSLKHRPGAMKRKRVMEGREMERFGRNLAQLVGKQEDGGAGKQAEGGAAAVAGEGASQSERWAALRRFIGGSMEKDKAFAAG